MSSSLSQPSPHILLLSVVEPWGCMYRLFWNVLGVSVDHKMEWMLEDSCQGWRHTNHKFVEYLKVKTDQFWVTKHNWFLEKHTCDYWTTVVQVNCRMSIIDRTKFRSIESGSKRGSPSRFKQEWYDFIRQEWERLYIAMLTRRWYFSSSHDDRNRDVVNPATHIFTSRTGTGQIQFHFRLSLYTCKHTHPVPLLGYRWRVSIIVIWWDPL